MMTRHALFISSFLVIAAIARADYNVRDYGATGNNITDDTAAIQAAIDDADAHAGGTVYFPNGQYHITGLTVGSMNTATNNRSSNISMRSETLLGTQLLYFGQATGCAVFWNKNKYAKMENLRITNRTGSRATTVGWRTAGLSNGTNSNGSVVQNCIIEGFHYGWQTSLDESKTGPTSSEITAINLSLSNCDSGFRNQDYNGLNFTFINVQINANAIGIDASTAGIHILSGAGSGNALDINFANGGNSSVDCFRSESTGRFLSSWSGSSRTAISVNNCKITATAKGVHAIDNQYDRITINNSEIAGEIHTNAYMSIENCKIVDTVPFHVDYPHSVYRVIGSALCPSGDINSPVQYPDTFGVTGGLCSQMNPVTGELLVNIPSPL